MSDLPFAGSTAIDVLATHYKVNAVAALAIHALAILAHLGFCPGRFCVEVNHFMVHVRVYFGDNNAPLEISTASIADLDDFAASIRRCIALLAEDL